MKNVTLYTLLAVFTFLALDHAIAEDLPEWVVSQGIKLNANRTFLHPYINLDGVKYQFDQERLEQSLTSGLSLYKEAQKDIKTGRSDVTLINSKIEIAKTALAYGIIAAGQYADNNAGLISIFTQIKEHLANESVPNGIVSPYYSMLGLASQSFVDKNGSTVDVDFVHLGTYDFKTLIREAEVQIAARSKEKDSPASR